MVFPFVKTVTKSRICILTQHGLELVDNEDKGSSQKEKAWYMREMKYLEKIKQGPELRVGKEGEG